MRKRTANVKKILIVEDEPAICQVCQRVLAREGFEVDVAANGQVAQEMVAKKQYDFCLVDIRTPTMNGKELYQWLREQHPQLAGQVVFTTGDMMTAGTESFLQRAGRLFLPKPFTTEELKTVMRQALEQAEK